MLETYTVVLFNSARNLKQNIRSSPLLYFLFLIMMIFSIFLIGFFTIFMIRNEVPISLDDIFFIVLFLFVLKASYDFYNYFTKSEPVTYAMSTGVSHFKTSFEIFLVVFWITLGLWIFLITLYNISLVMAGVNPSFPFVFLKFTMGIMLASVLGVTLVLHYFSNKRYRLIPLGFFYILIYQFNDITSVLVILVLSFVYLLISLNYCMDSYLYVNRKNRKNEKTQVWLEKPSKVIFLKEITILWRERVLNSIIFSASIMGIGAGYMVRFGAEEILPESLQMIASRITPEAYAFFGIYVLTIHGAVFISLSLFLNEEHTLWLINHMPIKTETVIYGKTLSIILPLICCLPFIAFYSAFTSGRSIVFLVFFLVFSYIAGIIICFPLGAKYVGKKSDILLLYSVSLLIFLILGIFFSINGVIGNLGSSQYFLYGFILLIEMPLLLISLKISAKNLRVKYKKIIN